MEAEGGRHEEEVHPEEVRGSRNGFCSGNLFSTVSGKQIQGFQEYENQLKKLKAECLFGFK